MLIHAAQSAIAEATYSGLNCNPILLPLKNSSYLTFSGFLNSNSPYLMILLDIVFSVKEFLDDQKATFFNDRIGIFQNHWINAFKSRWTTLRNSEKLPCFSDSFRVVVGTFGTDLVLCVWGAFTRVWERTYIQVRWWKFTACPRCVLYATRGQFLRGV